MRPKHCRIQNFGSYQDLEFSFDSLGLVLVSGPTGSGKSTLGDIVPWICFGVTSKDGAVDEVRSWGCAEPTVGTLDVDTQMGSIQITRVRGTTAQNDLYWTELSGTGEKLRGKNVLETQQLLEKRLGVDADTYAIGAYFSQFSTADQFFTMKAKDRRPILERITDVRIPVTLAEHASEARKAAKKELETLETTVARAEGSLDQLGRQKANFECARDQWRKATDENIAEYKAMSERFEAEKAQKYAELVGRLEALDGKIRPEEEFVGTLHEIRAAREELAELKIKHRDATAIVVDLQSRIAATGRDKDRYEKLTGKCPTCLGKADNPNKSAHIAKCNKALAELELELAEEIARLAGIEESLSVEAELMDAYEATRTEQAENSQYMLRFQAESDALQALEDSENVAADRLKQAREAVNPYFDQVERAKAEIAVLELQLQRLMVEVGRTNHRIASLTTLYDLSFVLRGELLLASVAELERETNRRLEEYFDGVFRVAFALEDSDKLTVEITNGGHACSYRQLSGGQRRQLTLCFWRALSKQAANAAGIAFSLVTMDEALNGLDDALKIKAFRLFEEMAGESDSVIVIDHSEALKGMFDTRFCVELQGENSVLTSEGLSREAA